MENTPMTVFILCATFTLTLPIPYAQAGNAPKIALPADAVGFTGALEGEVVATEWNGKWVNLKVTRATPAREGTARQARALIGATVSVVVQWERGPRGLQPKVDQAKAIKSFRRRDRVAATVHTEKGGALRLNAIPRAIGRADAPAAPARPAAVMPSPDPKAALPSPTVRAGDMEWGWVPVGGGGNLMMTAYHPRQAGLIALRSDVGACFVRNTADPKVDVWRSLTLSRSLSLEDSSFRSPSGFAFDPQNAKVMYVTCAAGVYKSADGGRTWDRKLKVDMRISHQGKKRGEPVQVDPVNPDVVYAGSYDRGLFRSTDGGERWSVVTAIPRAKPANGYGIPCILFDPRSGAVGGRCKTLYVGVSGHGIYRSTDGGAGFARISDALQAPHTLRIDSRSALYVSAGGGLYRYEDGTWSASLLRGATGFDVDRTDPARIVAVSGGVQRSTDRGRTWTKLTPVLRDSHGWWRKFNLWGGPNSITLDPHNPGQALWVTCYMCYHADDIWRPRTIPWDAWYQGIEETVSFEVMTPPGSKYFYTGFGDIVGLRHRNLTEYPGVGDRTPGHVVPGFDYFPGDPKDVWHVRVGGHKYRGIEVFRSRDAGDRWVKVGAPFARGQPMAMAAIAVSATDRDNAVVCSVLSRNGNRYTKDGGKTWKLCADLPGNLMGHNPREYWYFGNVLCSDKVEPRFYAYNYRTGRGNRGKLWTTTDGAKWSVAAGNLPSSSQRQKLVTLFAAHNKAGWLLLSAAFAKTSMLSQDGGATWKRLRGFDAITSADFGRQRAGGDSPTLFVIGRKTGGKHGVYFSPDFFDAGAPTWKRISVQGFPLLDPREVRGCKQEYGRVFVAAGGRGWLYGRRVDR